MRMLRTGIYMQAAEQLASQTVFRQHTTNGMLYQALRMFVADIGRRMLTLSARITGVCENHTVGPFLTRHSYLFGIDNHYMIATINMRCVTGFVLTLDDVCDLAGYTAQYLIFCIYQNPRFFNGCLVGVSGFIALMIHVFLL